MFWKSRRHIVTLMGLWGFFNLYTVFGIGIGTSIILSLVSLGAAKLGIYPLVVGVSFPSIQEVYSNWAPEYEKTRMAGIVQNGSQIGAFTSFLLSGVLVEYFGWESVFYFFGGIGCLWFLLWMIYIKRDPASDPRISRKERDFIESNRKKENHKKYAKVPWKLFLTSKAVWAQTVCSSCDAFTTFTYLTQIPSYLNDVLGFNMGATGFFSAAPFLMFILLTPVASTLSDFLLSSKLLSTVNVRKLFIVCGMLMGTICLIIMSNATDMMTIWVCLIVAVGTTSLTKCAYFTNPLDIAPAYASVVMGFSNTIATIPGVVAPTLAGFIVRNGTREEWRIVFYIAAGLTLFGMAYSVLFGQGEVQEWAKREQKKLENATEPLQLQQQLEDEKLT
uniref:Major facilitator superfamily (MFS) profile domain-containing protein n=2 Tax=Lutzomyia longipalpis TaxID=7200 RepID=A0A1B0GHQ8_LUTLO